MTFLDNMTVRARVYALAGLGVGFALLLAMVTIYALHEMDQSDAKVAGYALAKERTKALRVAALEVRRSEKDALLRRDARYVDLNQKARKTAAETAEALLTAREIQPVRSELEKVRDGVKLYGETFDEMWADMIRAGLDETSGAQGRLRDSVRAVEEAIKGVNDAPLMISLLTMRRHEKDFLLRRSTEYVDRAAKESAGFIARLSAAVPDAALRRDLTEKTEFYIAKLRETAAAIQESGDGAKKLGEVYASFGPALDRVEQFAEENVATENRLMEDFDKRIRLIIYGFLQVDL